MLTVRKIVDLCDYVKAICQANAVVILITLNELNQAASVKDITDHIIRESKGHTILRDQSVRNTLINLAELSVIKRTEERKGERRIYRHRLTGKSMMIIRALEVFFEEIRNQINK